MTLIVGKGFLVEKAAREYYFSLLPQGNMPTIIGGLIENTPEYKAYIQGATWQREQLIKELREWAENEKQRKNTVVSPMFIHFNNLLAKLDLLEGEK